MSLEILEKQPEVKRKITKAKLAKHGGLDIEFEQIKYIEKVVDGEVVLIEMPSDESPSLKSFVHDDLKHAFNLMRSHLAIICDLPEAKGKNLHELDDDEEALLRIKVIGFSIGGSGDNEGVSLTGFKTLKGGKILNLNAPFTKYVDESGEGYEFSDDLNHLMNHATTEVELYIDGKIAPSAPDLFNNSDEIEEDKSEFE